MEHHLRRRPGWIGWLCSLLLVASAVAIADAAKAGDAASPDQAQRQMETLSQMGYHPFLMPLIMENRDVIGLTNEQVRVFRAWRNKNRVPLIHAMNRILQSRVDFQRIALNPQTTEPVLRAKQDEIFKLHRKVLEYQLSCRRSILDTFTPEQWEEFRFVLMEHGYTLD